MKKVIVLVACVLCAAVFGQNKPQIAVYAVSEILSSAEKKEIEVKMLDAFGEGGRFTRIERSSVFLSSIAEELKTQNDGSVSDDQIRNSGKQAGVQSVCVASFSKAFGKYTLSARVLDVETAEVTGSGSAKIEDMDYDNIMNAVDAVFKQITSQMKAAPTVYIDIIDRGAYYYETHGNISRMQSLGCNCTEAKEKKDADYIVVIKGTFGTFGSSNSAYNKLKTTIIVSNLKTGKQKEVSFEMNEDYDGGLMTNAKTTAKDKSNRDREGLSRSAGQKVAEKVSSILKEL
jgi:hypothetical protein